MPIKKSFRIKFILSVIITMVLGIVLTAIFYYFTFNINLDSGYTNKISTLSQYKRTFFINAFVIFLTFSFVSIIIITIFSIVYTHKIAEPLLKIKKTAKEFSDGNFDIVLHLRKDDAIYELPESINHYISFYKERCLEIKKISDAMHQNSEKLLMFVENNDFNSVQNELHIISEYRRKLNNLIHDIKI